MINSPQVRFHNEGPFEINDKLAGVVPMALPQEQIAMMNDIMENEQRDPIVLYKNKIVDGRCRMKALTQLGKNYIYKELDSELTEQEVKTFVKSVNTRRNLTLTQKIIVACNYYLEDEINTTIKETAMSWGISAGSLNNAIYIAKYKPDFIEPLFNGLTVEIRDKDGNIKFSNKVTAVYAYVKREHENVLKKEDEHSWSADSSIQTQAGKEWFYSFIKKHSITNIEIMIALADSANYKFQFYKKQKDMI